MPKILREAGFTDEIEIAPNLSAAAFYPAETPKTDVIRSLEVILQDLRNEVERQALGVANE